MEDMINLQVDYFSIPSKQIIELSKGYINNNIEYFEKLSKWDNVLDKNSVEAGIYIEWQTQIYFEFMRVCSKGSTKIY